MTDDLDTLLRNAGREPTIDLDVDAIAAAGSRRAIGRRVAGVAAAVAAVAAAAVIVPGLLPTSTPDIDIAPQPDGATTTEVETTGGDGDAAPAALDPSLIALLSLDQPGASSATALDPTAVAQALGVDLVALGWEDVALAFDAQLVRSDGSSGVQRLETGRMLGDPIVAADGAVWWTALDGTVRQGDPSTGTIVDVLAGDGPSPWLPVGIVSDTDEVLVSRIGGPDGQPGAESLGALAMLAPDGRVTDLPFPRLESLAVQEGAIYADAHLAGEHLIAVALEDTGTVRIVHGGLGEELLDLAVRTAPSPDEPSWPAGGVGVVGDELWVLDRLEGDVAGEGGPTAIRRHDLDGTELSVLPLPGGLVAGRELTALRVASTADVVLVEAVEVDGVVESTIAVFPTAVDAVADPTRAVRLLDGEMRWSVARGSVEPTPLASCADGGVPVNQRPAPGGLLFSCGDAVAALGPDELWAFVQVPGAAGVESPMTATDVQAMLELWAVGPTAAQAEDGLTGGLDETTATIAGVTIDGTTVVVDLAPGPQVGVLGTTGGRSQFVQAVTGMVLADEAYEGVRITLDGDCEAWAVLGEGEGCTTYTRADAAFAQGVASCARDDALNQRPPAGEVVVWRWCPDGAITRPYVVGVLPVPHDGTVSTTPTEGELLDLLLATFAPVTAEELARGLDAPGLVLDPNAEPALFDPPGLSVAVVGSLVVVDYDPALADLMQISAPFAESLMVTAIAGAVFQFDDFDRLEFRVGGSCEAYEERLEGEFTGGCTRIDRRALPWDVG